MQFDEFGIDNPFYAGNAGCIVCEDNVVGLAKMPNDCVDLTVTSPPYDNLRTYNGFNFDFCNVAAQLWRVTKTGGVVVWVVGDATVEGSETGSSFRQVLHFREIGFNIHDTMIWEKASRIPTQDRYYNVVEYMFVLSKGKPKTMNFICDHVNSTEGQRRRKDKVINKGKNEKYEDRWLVTPALSRRSNVWVYGTKGNGTNHPAIFPDRLAADHIQSWSAAGDVVLDPFVGSGTTVKAAVLNGRIGIGFDISADYCAMASVQLIQAEQSLVLGDPR